MNNRSALEREQAVLGQTLSTSANIAAAISNVRLQRLVLLLTAASVALATWALIKAASG